MNRNQIIRKIQGICKHNNIEARGDILDIAMAVLDWDLNDPIDSLSNLTTSQLTKVHSYLLGWFRIQQVRASSGIILEEAKSLLQDGLVANLSKDDIASLTKIAKQKGKKMTFDPVEELRERMNSRGRSQLIKLEGSSGVWPIEKRVPTGILSLDCAIGIGGIPRGRIVEIFGQESSGKSSTMILLAAQAQREGMTVLYMDAENGLDPNYCKRLGLDIDNVLVNYPESIQDAIETIRNACEISKSADMPDLLVVVDSVPAMPAQEVEDGNAEKNQFRASGARHWAQWMPTLVKSILHSNSTVMLINQTRQSMDMYTKLSDTTPGGKAIKFAASVRLQISRSTPDGSKEDSGAYAQQIKIDVIKNKVGSPMKKAYYTLYLGGDSNFWGVSPVDDVVDTAIARGVVLAGKKSENGEIISKSNWFCLPLKPGWLELMRQDEIEAWQDENHIGDGELDPNAPEFSFSYRDDTEFVQVYYESKFKEEIANYPSLVEAIREEVLESLNEGSLVDDLENTEEPDDEEPDDYEDHEESE